MIISLIEPDEQRSESVPLAGKEGPAAQLQMGIWMHANGCIAMELQQMSEEICIYAG